MTAGRRIPALGFPRSFLGMLVAGFLLASLPLLCALLVSAWQTQRLTEQGRDAVLGAARAAATSRALASGAGSLERLALQLALQPAPEPRLRENFARAHTAFRQLAAELAQLPVGEPQLATLERALEREQALYDLVLLPARDAARPAAVRRLANALLDDAYEVLGASRRLADREVERLGAAADEAYQRIVILALVASALALAAALALTRLIARPIAELDAAIRRLGDADFARPVRVSGPADLRSLGERLDWLRRRLIELEAQKSRFLRHLSHDLKTPLAALREGTELLNDQVAGPLAPPQRQVVTILRDNSVKLHRLIEDLLDYQRALHAAAGLHLGAVELQALLRQAVRAHQLAAQGKALRVELDSAELTVRADAGKLRSVVDNLVGNAIKFTPPGGTVRVRARRDGDAATIEVEDTGPGVPAEEREAIFEAFFRGRAGAFGRAEGTGLGLAIAREFTEAHGGRIEAVPGARGGYFRVTLPLRPTAPLAEAA